MVVPKKIVKLRVQRTKMKRQIYNLSLPFLMESSGKDLLLVINKKIVTAERLEIMKDLIQLFSKLK